jgi:hypothetical protein
MHELMDEHLCLFPIVQFVKPFTVHFDDICHGETCDFVEDLAEAPYARYRAGLGIETADTKYPFFLYMMKFNTMYKCVDAFFYFWSEYIFHRHAIVAVSVESNNRNLDMVFAWFVTLVCLPVVALAKSGPESDSGCISLRFIYQNDERVVMLSVTKHPSISGFFGRSARSE